jgi:WD40 repeat protein/serine/threonine protein kinase/tetratricopeptide (TPR) repeat protein
MSGSTADRDPIEMLADSFLARFRQGERPSVEEYATKYPELADQIRELLPALVMLEQEKSVAGGVNGTGTDAGSETAGASGTPRQLGDYVILREIGRGGMGVVYESLQQSLGRHVALKVLPRQSLAGSSQLERFRLEARAAARLHHTNIVPVFGVGECEGVHYYAMQFIQGQGLDIVIDVLRALRKGGLAVGETGSKSLGTAGQDDHPLTAALTRALLTGQFGAPEPEARSARESTAAMSAASQPLTWAPDVPAGPGSSAPVNGTRSTDPGCSAELSSNEAGAPYYRSVARVGVQVAEALEYANRQGTLHRDIKPSNLLLDNHGNVWVADFGLAKTAGADDLTHSGDIVGTIRYMAPERFQGKCDARSDVYSLGLTLYELIALRPAYEVADRHRLMERVLHEEPERLRKLAPGVPRDLETIVAKATARDPASRYATAGALADDLRRFIEDRPIRARRVSPAERLARWCRRNPAIAGSIGVTALALVAVAALSLVYARRQARHASERAEANTQISKLASDLKQESSALTIERSQLRTALAESKSRLARLDLERGQIAFEKGQIGVGMLWTVESMRMAAEAGDAAGRHVALANLAAWRSSHLDFKEVFPHSDAVTAVAFSPDGKTIVTGSMDKTARLWNVNSGKPIGRPMAHQEWARSAAFSPAGRLLATGSNDKTARLWDAATGQQVGPPLEHPGFVLSVAFSPDGRTLVTGCQDGAARLWSTTSGRLVGQEMVHSSLVWSVAFSPDGKTILTGSWDKTARLWDAATGRPHGPPMEHLGEVWSAAFSPDGKTILTGSVDKTARLWDAATGRPVGKPMEHPDAVRTVAFSPDGKTVVTGCADRTARLWDTVTGERVGRSLEHQMAVWAVAFSADGRSILTGCADGMARLWDGMIGQPVGRVLEHGSLWTVDHFSNDGKSIFSVGIEGGVRRWDVASGQFLGHPVELGHVVWVSAISPDGKTILTGSVDKTARTWDAASGQPLGVVLEHSDMVYAVAFSPNGKTILTGSADGKAQLWNAATGRPVGKAMKHLDVVRSVAFSPDGKTILTGSWDKTARTWDAASGQPSGVVLKHSVSVQCAAFSPEGKAILTGSADGKAQLWDAATGRPLGPPLEHPIDVVSVAFSPDARWILTGCWDNTARLWDVTTRVPVGPSLPHMIYYVEFTFGACFSPDGRFLLTAGRDGARLRELPLPLPDDLPRLSAWVKGITGLELSERGSIRVLDRTAWQESRRRLEDLGGPPPADPAPRSDPIVFGDKPEARGDGWKEKGFWDRAEAAYSEAIHARRLNLSLRDTLVRFQIERGHPDRAAATLEDALRMMPENSELGLHLGLIRLWMGDLTGWRKLNGELLARFGRTNNFNCANQVAWACSMGADGAADPQAPVRLAEVAVGNTNKFARSAFLDTLGWALFRAGRVDDAIRQVEEAIQIRRGMSDPDDWPLLAMAHHRLGHHDQARQWLARLREYEYSTDPSQFWHVLRCRVVNREAEAMVLHDPVFPADPFAP